MRTVTAYLFAAGLIEQHAPQQQLPCMPATKSCKPYLLLLLYLLASVQDNSCSVCRHELPTDDHSYESRKEREAQEAEDRKGAANALSHNEFAYI
jgi:hypothetical protein